MPDDLDKITENIVKLDKCYEKFEKTLLEMQTLLDAMAKIEYYEEMTSNE